MFNVFKKILFLITLFNLSFILFSCNEEPTFIGSTLLTDTITIYPISSNDHKLIIGNESVVNLHTTFNKGVIHIGRYNEYESITLMRFFEPIKDYDSLDFLKDYTSDKIISCKLTLYTQNYALGDTTNPSALSFKVYKAQSYWSNLSNWDSIFNNNVIDKSKIIAEFDGQIVQKDTMDNIVIDFDKDLVIEWFKEWYKNKTEDSTLATWGIAFVPDENSNIIRTFKGVKIGTEEKGTRLEIIFHKETDNLDTLVITSAVEKSFYKFPNMEESLSVQGSIETRGILKFDVSVIPPLASIHTAQLQLTLNRDKCLYGNFNLDSTLSGALLRDSSEITSFDFIRNYYAEKDLNTFYFKSITSAVEYWNRYTNGKGEIIIYPEGTRNEYYELDRLVFYGIDEPDSTKRPKLTIIYSTRPEFNKK